MYRAQAETILYKYTCAGSFTQDGPFRTMRLLVGGCTSACFLHLFGGRSSVVSPIHTETTVCRAGENPCLFFQAATTSAAPLDRIIARRAASPVLPVSTNFSLTSCHRQAKHESMTAQSVRPNMRALAATAMTDGSNISMCSPESADTLRISAMATTYQSSGSTESCDVARRGAPQYLRYDSAITILRTAKSKQ